MTGHPETLQSRGHEKTGTFAGPRIGRRDDSEFSSTCPSPEWHPRAHGLPGHVRGPPLLAARPITSKGRRAFEEVGPRGELSMEFFGSRLWSSG